jgi:beta-galactosidase
MNVFLKNYQFCTDDGFIPIYGAAVHYWRLEREKWSEILDKVKGMGFTAIETYIPWEIHELEDGRFDFGSLDPKKDIDTFLKLCEEKGFKVIVRPGPQINSELPYFGYPKRVLDNPKYHMKTSYSTKAILNQASRPVPALNYANEDLYKEFAKWYDAICSILKKHLTPKGCIIAVQVDNEMNFFFHVTPYLVDYSEFAIELYREFLREKYGNDINKLNKYYGTNYKGFDEVKPPTKFNAKTVRELRYYLDWIEFREHYLIKTMTKLAKMLKERLGNNVLLFHNYPHPLSPGIAKGVTTTPYNLIALEKELNFVGFDIYSRKELYDHVKLVTSYVVGSSRVPFIPEFIAGVWPWYLRPTAPQDEEFVSKAAVMHGIKGFSRYMIVERDRWMGSPIARDGYIREDRYQVHKKFIETLRKYEFVKFEKKREVLILMDREYDRLEAATALISFPGDFLEPLLGFSEYPNALYVSDDTFGFEETVQMVKSLWFEKYYKVLTDLEYTFDISDSELDIARMKQYKAVCIPSFEFMTQKLQDKIYEVAKDGGIVVLGPKIPKLNEYFEEYKVIEDAISSSQKVDIIHDGRTIAIEYKLSKGAIALVRNLNDMPYVLESLFRLYNIHKIEKAPVAIDAVLHINREKPDEALLFVANPTSQYVKATITLPYDVKEVVEVWSEKKLSEVRYELVDELPPYNIKTYLLLKR